MVTWMSAPSRLETYYKNNSTYMTKKRQTPPVYIDYIVEVLDYRLSYSYSISLSKLSSSDEAWDEYYSIHIQGRLLSPKNLAVETVNIGLVQHENSIRNRADDYCQAVRPRGVGSIRRSKSVLSGIVSIPKDAISTVISILNKGAFISLHGPKVGRELFITSLQFDTSNEEMME